MLQNYLALTGWLLLLVFLQATVFNHIHLLGYATPLPYVYFIVKLPSTTSRVGYLLPGFLVGLLVDILSSTPGMAAASLCAVGLVAPPLLTVLLPADRDEGAVIPSTQSMGRGKFMLYALLLTLLHCTLFFTIEAFSVHHAATLLLKTAGSTALTFLVIIALESIRKHATGSRTARN